jgi:hypothetical protein
MDRGWGLWPRLRLPKRRLGCGFSAEILAKPYVKLQLFAQKRTLNDLYVFPFEYRGLDERSSCFAL